MSAARAPGLRRSPLFERAHLHCVWYHVSKWPVTSPASCAVDQSSDREMAIPSVFIGKPIEHVTQHIDVVGQGQFHDLQFFGIQQVAKRDRVTNETMKGFSDFCLGRGINK